MRTLTFLRTIGSGGFGTVYLAELSSGRGFQRQVAVKVLQKNRPDSAMFLSRIRDEARLLGLLQDDAILKVLDMVQVEGMDAVLMEYVEGLDLDSLTEAGHSPPPRALAEIGASVAGALARAHNAHHPTSGVALNVIHRDVKPGNVMITSSGGVKLLDFGVARAHFDARESYTGQLVLGTLHYMAPEYIVTGEVSPAADVYGLALTLWQVAAGEVFGQPKVRKNSHERRVGERMGAIRKTHGDLVPVLEEMLSWNPTDRPNAGTVEQHLLLAADGLSGTGLRSWSRQVVPEVARSRNIGADSAGLLGRTVQIGAPELGVPLGETADLIGADSPTPRIEDLSAPYVSPSDPAFVTYEGPAHTGTPANGAAQGRTASPPPPPPPANLRSTPVSLQGAAPASNHSPSPRRLRERTPTPTPRRSARRRARRSSTLGLIIKGLVIGGGIGFLALLAVVVIVLFS